MDAPSINFFTACAGALEPHVILRHVYNYLRVFAHDRQAMQVVLPLRVAALKEVGMTEEAKFWEQQIVK